MQHLIDNIDIDGNLYTKEDIIDLHRLQRQLLIEKNILATIAECANIWLGYSNDLAASWLFFPKRDEDILNSIESSDYFKSYNAYCK